MYFDKVVKMEDYEMDFVLKRLSDYLEKYYNKKVYLLIDEYDVPLQTAYSNGYYPQALTFIKGLYTTTFKVMIV